MRETSLDEWAGGAAGDEADGEGDADDEDEPDVEDAVDEVGDQPDDSDPEPESKSGRESESEPEPEPEPEQASVEPAVSTYDWTPTGADCQACGAAVERRWRDDGQLVCADCKAW